MSNRKKESVSEIAVQQLQQQLEALRNGSKEAFDFIANFYMPHLKAMAGTVLKSEQDAEDTVQEALIRAYKSLESFRGESRISTWLCRIVLNQAKNRLQDKYHKNVVLLEDLLDKKLLEELLPAVPGEYETEIFRESIFYEISQLPESWRSIILLRLEGLSYQEIADCRKCSVGTVKSYISRARRSLKKNLEKYL